MLHLKAPDVQLWLCLEETRISTRRSGSVAGAMSRVSLALLRTDVKSLADKVVVAVRINVKPLAELWRSSAMTLPFR